MIAGVSDWILSLHGAVALAIVFAIPALEASAFIGFLFPGEIAILLGGVLAYQGRIPLPATIVAAILGAIVGDTIGYFVGHRWGRVVLRAIIRRVPILRHRVDDHLDTAERYLRARGGRAVFFGRFTAALRVMVPGLAGMSGMPYREFAAYNAAGGIIWGTGFVLLGFFAGAAWRQVAGVAGKAGLVLLAAILLGLIGTRIIREWEEHSRRLRSAAVNIAKSPPVTWVRGHFPRQVSWVRRRLDWASPFGFALTFVTVAGALCGWLLGGLTQDVVAHDEAVRLDPGVERFVLAHRTGFLTTLMRTATWLGSTAILMPLLAGVGGYFLLRRRDWRPGAKLLTALIGALALYDIVKPVVARPRPPIALRLMGVTGASFPSGHAAQAVAFYGMLAVLLSQGRSVGRRTMIWVLAGCVALLIGVSRIYLGVHWFTDVLGGFAAGGLWLCIVLSVMIVASSHARTRDRPTEGLPDG